jgi:hypothetical protein
VATLASDALHESEDIISNAAKEILLFTCRARASWKLEMLLCVNRQQEHRVEEDSHCERAEHVRFTRS